eukprot:7277443-Pyramimonas_sp.AAC.1
MPGPDWSHMAALVEAAAQAGLDQLARDAWCLRSRARAEFAHVAEVEVRTVIGQPSPSFST